MEIIIDENNISPRYLARNYVCTRPRFYFNTFVSIVIFRDFRGDSRGFSNAGWFQIGRILSRVEMLSSRRIFIYFSFSISLRIRLNVQSNVLYFYKLYFILYTIIHFILFLYSLQFTTLFDGNEIWYYSKLHTYTLSNEIEQ